MKRILFQGDSITDSFRARDNEYNRGTGYSSKVAGSLMLDFPNEYECSNRGVGGNRIVDLYARIKSDIINVKPDVLSILIGVNDVWHEFETGNGVDADKFEKIYCMLIEEIKAELPKIQILIMEPFILKGTAAEKDWESFRAEVEKRAIAAKRVDEKYGLVFVPLMHKFDEAAKLAPVQYWAFDGVHPTDAGHELIKRAWLEGFEEMK